MKKRFLPLCMLLITIVLAQASFVANAAGTKGKYTPRNSSKATISSFMKSIRANQETGLIDPALVIAGRKTAQSTTRDADYNWGYAGPDNFGGQTRAIVFDKDKNVYIGTMGGDVYKTTNNGITFRRITNLNLTISCMVMNSDGDIFVGTGDGRNSQVLNGLSDYGYESGFAGEGIYRMAAGTTELEHLSATSNWTFVNELAIANGKIYAATSNGVMVSEDNGDSWTTALAGNFRSIKSNNNGDVLAADTSNVFLSKDGAAFTNVSASMPANNNPKIIAMAPNDPNYMYIAYLNDHQISGVTEFYTGDIYYTADGGATWFVALSQTNLYPIFGTNSSTYDGLVEPNGFMAVYPDNAQKVLIGYDNLWLLEGDGHNNFRPTQVSDNGLPISSLYLHQGIQDIVFHPTKKNSFYVGTNGGVYRVKYKQGYYLFTNCNRYFITDEQHCSPTRMMAVGVGGTNKVIGGCLDHGTIRIDREENVNNITTGIAIFPNPDIQSNAYQQFGSFTPSFAGGPCAISTVNPNIMFVSGTGDLSSPIHRTESNGEDYDISNFTGITNEGVFRTPLALYENYDDPHTEIVINTTVLHQDTIDYTVYDSTYYVWDSIGGVYTIVDTVHVHDSVWNVNIYTTQEQEVIDLDTLIYAVRDTLYVGTEFHYYSNSGNYPIDGIVPALPDSLHNPAHLNGQAWIKGDTISGLHDPISSVFVCGTDGNVYMTRSAILFNKVADWLLLGEVDGVTTAVTLNSTGEFVLVGTNSGKLYKFPRLGDIYVEQQVDPTDTLNYIYSDIATFLVNDFGSQAVTSIAIDPENDNNVVVTLGNYGEGHKYVYRATDGATFTAVAGNNLPASPVYASIIEKQSKDILVGTEFGIYVSSDNGANWTKTGNLSCPVMEIKQAIVPNHPDKVDVLYDEMGIPTYIIYPGVSNEGVIFAATYGEGLVVCDFNVEEASDDDDNTNIAGENVDHLNIYPNPVRNNAQVNVKLDSDASVSYTIYDLSGRMIVNNNLGTYAKGTHTLNINTANLSNGSYIIRVQAGDKSESTKFLVY